MLTKSEQREMYRLMMLVHRLQATRKEQNRYMELCRKERG